jgi:hypothetical protein
MELKLSANLSFKEPEFGNILEKILVKIDEDNEGIYLCHFKKKLQLVIKRPAPTISLQHTIFTKIKTKRLRIY